MSGHTPGPWATDQSGDIYEVATNRGIGEAWHSEEIWKANARLIAAAPELLEALQWMVANDETCEGDEPLNDHSGVTWNEINSFWIGGLNKARAAIAKATGETA